MGVNLSVVFANIFMSVMFFKYFNTHTADRGKIPLFKRFLDDIAGFWNGSETEFQSFVARLNDWSLREGWCVQFEVSKFGAPLPFLDVTLYWNNHWQTKLYFKETNVHAYLCTSSFHPENVFHHIPKGVALRIRRLCSERKEYRKFATLFSEGFFPRRGYSIKKVRGAFRKVDKTSCRVLMAGRPRMANKNFPFVFPFTRQLEVKTILRVCHRILKGDPVTRSVFTRQQLFAFKKGKCIRDYICRASLNRVNVVPGCSPCGHCSLDPHLLTSRRFQSRATGQVFQVKGCLSCDTPHVVYLIECTRCGKQGIGECSDARRRLQHYISAIRRGPPEPVPCCSILRHFLDGQHSVDDFKVLLIDKIPFNLPCHPACPSTVRTRLENIWTKRVQPELNVRRQLHSSFSGGSQARRPDS